MIYHFVPFDMRYWNLILHQYKWYIASRQKKGLQKDLCKCLFTPFYLSFPMPHCTPVERHKRNICLFSLPLLYTRIWYVCLKKWQLKMLGEKVSRSHQSQEKLGKGKKKGGGVGRRRRNMTAVAEGNVTRCQGLWHDSLVRWNPTGDIRAASAVLGAGNQRLLLWCQSSLAPSGSQTASWTQYAQWDRDASIAALADVSLK